MNMSDIELIVTVLKMQADLKSAMDEMNTLTNELQRRLGSNSEVPPKKTIKIKKQIPEPSKKPNRAILAWNAYRMEIKNELELSGVPFTNKDVLKKAVEKKNQDPEGYTDFTNIWLAAN
jgi:hypothetical protein